MRPNYLPFRALGAGIVTVIACQLLPGSSMAVAQAQLPQNSVLSGGAGKPTLVERPNNMRPASSASSTLNSNSQHNNSQRSDYPAQQLGYPVPASPTLSDGQAGNRVIQAGASAPIESQSNLQFAAAQPTTTQQPTTQHSTTQHSTTQRSASNAPFTQTAPPRESLAVSQTTVAKTPLPPASQLPSSEGPRKGGTLQMLMSVGSSLLIVVGLFLGVAWCYRKTLNSSFSGGLPKEVVNVVGRTPLAARQQLVLVRFGSKLVLVSMIQGEARTISEITDPLEVDQLVGLCASSQPGSISESFRSVLNQGATV